MLSGGQTSPVAKSGLLNSTQITASQLEKHLEVKTEIEVCVDGNECDKYLTEHRPNVCVIQALWVTPVKLKELQGIHKRVKFVVLIHSEVSFLSNEGNAIEWIFEYNKLDHVFPGFNSERTFKQFEELGIIDVYLPNVYLDVEFKGRERRDNSGTVHVGCFGAIRPFKNQLIQAVAAILFANRNNWHLHFHMNTSRAEQGGESALKNIRALFDTNKHQLIEHGWKNREDFLDLISRMDVCLQVSLTESFNITAADSVHENVPVVVSPTIDWMPPSQWADTEDADDIVKNMEQSIVHRNTIVKKSVKYLNKYNDRALDAWKDFLFK